MENNMLSKVIITNIHKYLVRDSDMENLCMKANIFNLAGVVVGPSSLEKIRKYKGNSKIGVSIGYPSGMYPYEAKVEEISLVEEVSSTVDSYYVVMGVGNYLSGNVQQAKEEFIALGKTEKNIRLIVEFSKFSKDQIRQLCEFALESGISGLVSSACFYPYEMPETTPEQIELVRKYAKSLEIIPFVQEVNPDLMNDFIKSGADFVMTGNINELI